MTFIIIAIICIVIAAIIIKSIDSDDYNNWDS